MRFLTQKHFPIVFKYIFSLSLLTLLIRVGGFFEKMTLAHFFGTGASLDAYFVAIQVPMMFYFTFAALIQPSLLPIFVKYFGESHSGKAFGQARVWAFIFLGIVSIAMSLCYLYTDALVGLLAPGFDVATAELCATLLHVLLPLSSLLGLLPLATFLLNAQRKFTLPPIAEFCMKCVFLFGIIVFSKPWGIVGVAYAICLATVVWFSINGFALGYSRKYDSSSWEFSRADFKIAFFLMLAPCLGKVISQLSMIVENAICSQIQPGAITALNFSKKIVDLPLLAISLATGTVLYTYFSEYSTKGDMESLTSLLANGMRIMLLIFLPLAVLTSVLAEPIIGFVYERGEFDDESTQLVSSVLFWLAPSMVLYSIEMLLMRHYFSRRDVWKPILIGALCVAVRLGLMFTLVPIYGIVAIAVAIVLSRLLKMILLILIAYKNQVFTLRDLEWPEWLKLVPATVLAGLVALGTSYIAQQQLSPTFVGRFLHLALAGTAGMVSYFLALWMTRSKDSILFLQWIRKR